MGEELRVDPLYLVRVSVPDGQGGWTPEEVIGELPLGLHLRPGVELSALERDEVEGMLDLMRGYGEERCYSDQALLSFRRRLRRDP